MTISNTKKFLTLTMAAAATTALASSAEAANGAGFADLSQGYQVASNHGDAGKHEEGKCGEGKCGEDKADKEGKCGEGKCGEDK